jgi:hypothetical protein
MNAAYRKIKRSIWKMKKKKIKILHVAQAAGGVDRYIRMLLKYLDKEKFENIQFIQVLLEANGLAAGKDHQFKGRYDAEKNAVIISLEKDEQSALSPQKCTT